MKKNKKKKMKIGEKSERVGEENPLFKISIGSAMIIQVSKQNKNKHKLYNKKNKDIILVT